MRLSASERQLYDFHAAQIGVMTMSNHESREGTPSDNGAEPATTREQLELQFLTVREVAQLLRIGRNLVYDLIARGEIPHIRLGNRILVPRYALARAIERMTYSV